GTRPRSRKGGNICGITNRICRNESKRMSYESAKARTKMDYRCDFIVVSPRIPGGVHRLLEIDERLWPHRCSDKPDESYRLLRLRRSHAQVGGDRKACSE